MNNASPSDAVGRTNSLATGLSAVMRLIAPLIGTNLFALTANSDLFYPFNYFFVWHLNSFMCIVAIVISLGLPAAVNRHRLHK